MVFSNTVRSWMPDRLRAQEPLRGLYGLDGGYTGRELYSAVRDSLEFTGSSADLYNFRSFPEYPNREFQNEDFEEFLKNGESEIKIQDEDMNGVLIAIESGGYYRDIPVWHLGRGPSLEEAEEFRDDVIRKLDS